jgi:hypothetical protein
MTRCQREVCFGFIFHDMSQPYTVCDILRRTVVSMSTNYTRDIFVNKIYYEYGNLREIIMKQLQI